MDIWIRTREIKGKEVNQQRNVIDNKYSNIKLKRWGNSNQQTPVIRFDTWKSKIKKNRLFCNFNFFHPTTHNYLSTPLAGIYLRDTSFVTSNNQHRSSLLIIVKLSNNPEGPPGWLSELGSWISVVGWKKLKLQKRRFFFIFDFFFKAYTIRLYGHMDTDTWNKGERGESAKVNNCQIVK
jgi:hypothetical protein